MELYLKMYFFTGDFLGFDLLYRNTYFRAVSCNTYHSAGRWLDILANAKIQSYKELNARSDVFKMDFFMAILTVIDSFLIEIELT